MTKRLLITGAAGVLGTHIVARALATTDFSVIASSSSSPLAYVQRIGTRVEKSALGRLTCISREDSCSPSAIEGLSAVINCAFPRRGDGVALAEGLHYQTDLMSAVSLASVGRFVNVSTQSLYDPFRDYAASESSPIVVGSAYSAAKFASELLAKLSISGGALVNARLASLAGPDYDERILNRWVRQALAGQPLMVAGGDQVIDYMDVRDAASAILRIATNLADEPYEIVNIGSTEPMALLALAHLVEGVAATRTGSLCGVQLAELEGRPTSSALDCSLLIGGLGYRPEYRLYDTVADIIDVYLGLVVKGAGRRYLGPRTSICSARES